MTVCASCGHENSAAARFCEACAAALGGGSGEHRKVVSVLFCDVVGSTALGESTDPEALRGLLARYFERMKGIVESHGGSVEKFIGDAVMAVFGVPVVHEDDALRACRAAVEMREAFAGLGIEGRIGVSTGEVVTGTEERLATGDALNVAARLQQAAQPGEVLILDATLALAGDAVEVEPVEPLVLKGKAEPVPAFRLLAARAAAERRHDTVFVGRDRELGLLAGAWERSVAEQRCELVTIVGDAGLGKSRLAAEALASVETRVVRGRCLPYGAGVTYWPVVEVVKQLDGLPSDPGAAAAIRSLLGESAAATSAEEIAWAFRKLLEEQAPLVVVFDDIQWGEETFLDLIEHVALLSSGSPLLLLCMARPELLDSRSSWPVTVRLEPLNGEDSASLIGAGVPEGLRSRIAAAAAGNPLFIGEMLAMTQEAGDEVEVVVPATLKALLAARLDRLDPAERRVLERGAVEGETFHRGAVQALAPDETQVTPRLAALVRKELIRPDRPQLVGEDGFRFRHLLIRDAAYDALPKATRAELHARFAVWLEEHGAELVELDEILGYHLEQTCRYRAELGLPYDDELAAAARRRLTTVGYRALLWHDSAAAANLLTRAAALLATDALDLQLELDLVGALFDSGDNADALRVAQSIAERAAAAGDRVGELCALLEEELCRLALQPEGAAERLTALVAEALPIFEDAGDDLALSTAYRALGNVANVRVQMDARLEVTERALIHLRRAGIAHREERLVYSLAMAQLHGSTPVSKLCEWLDEQEELRPQNALLREGRAEALAMLGRFDEARAMLAGLRAELADRGAMFRLADATSQPSVQVELRAGNFAAAVELGEEGCRLLELIGEKSYLSTAAGKLAQALYALDRLEGADAWAGRAAELGASDDAITQMLWRQVKAKVLARQGETAEAERLARKAVAIGEDTDNLDGQGDTYADLAEVLLLSGKPDEAAEALEQALERYERKGNLVSAGHASVRLAELQHAAPR